MRTRNPRNSNEPKLLVQVLQALADLKDTRGSTLRRISDQVQTAVKLSKVKPVPRNVFGQVRRALRHGVQNGVLKHRAGKFRLATASEINYALKYGITRRRKRKGAYRKTKRRTQRRSPSRVRMPRKRIRRHKKFFNAPLEENSLKQILSYSNVADQQHTEPEMDNANNYIVNTEGRRGRRKRPVATKKRRRRRRKGGNSRRRKPRCRYEDDINMAQDSFDVPVTKTRNRLHGKEKGKFE